MHPPVFLAFDYDEHNKKQLAQLRFGQAAKLVHHAPHLKI
jgi:hypothetical protein